MIAHAGHAVCMWACCVQEASIIAHAWACPSMLCALPPLFEAPLAAVDLQVALCPAGKLRPAGRSSEMTAPTTGPRNTTTMVNSNGWPAFTLAGPALVIVKGCKQTNKDTKGISLSD